MPDGAPPCEDICLIVRGNVHEAAIHGARKSHYKCAPREVPVASVEEYCVASEGAPLHCVVTHCVSEARDDWDFMQRDRHLFLGTLNVDRFFSVRFFRLGGCLHVCLWLGVFGAQRRRVNVGTAFPAASPV